MKNKFFSCSYLIIFTAPVFLLLIFIWPMIASINLVLLATKDKEYIGDLEEWHYVIVGVISGAFFTLIWIGIDLQLFCDWFWMIVK